MNQRESDPGTGVKEVIELLLRTPEERLWSLTFRLGASTQEEILHAFCLFILRKEDKGLQKLQAQSDNILAKNLAEKWQRRRNIEAFQVLCGHFQESESLITLAGIFKVLTQHGLCNRDLQLLAYKRALLQESSRSNVLEYDRFMEEARADCGPELAEILYKVGNLKLSSGFQSKAEASGATGSAQGFSRSDQPTTLQSTGSLPSLSELEISALPTSSFLNTLPSGASIPSHSCPGTDQSSQLPKSQDQQTEPTTLGSDPSKAAAKDETEDEEVGFYSFVILNAEEDEDLAETLKERLEGITESKGATFSSEFATPGRSLIRCMDDAITNSAFTLPLLTSNFNHFQERITDAALSNSIEKRPKYNTVVPLLPESNAMEERPPVLQSIIALQENKHFRDKALRILSPGNIQKQRKEWEKVQKEKRLKEQHSNRV